MRREVGHHAPAAMNNRLRQFRLLLLLALGASAFALAGGSARATKARGPIMRPAVVPHVLLGPLAQAIAAGKRGGSQSTCVVGGPFACYAPGQLQQAYDFPTDPHASVGTGQTILIVEAYGAPDITYDLATFDQAFGIPAPPSFTIYNQQTAIPGAQGSGFTFSWELETSLDVEWAHAMAPGANIVLAIANSDDSSDLVEVETEALPLYPGAIVTQSFGGDETGPFSDPNAPPALRPLYAADIAAGGTILASSGDFGATNGDDTVMASYPASDPLVLAVGGTEGNPYPLGLVRRDGHYGGEQAWNEPDFGIAGGGAPSTLFTAPAWQQGVTGQAMRAEPDVSYTAALNGGVVVVISCAPDPEMVGLAGCSPATPLAGVLGGTSVGSPQWAAIVAIANEARGRQGKPPVGQVAPLLYALASNTPTYDQDFHDITVGNNALAGSSLGFTARPGYDLATGLGTPNVKHLVDDLTRGPKGPPPPPPHGGPTPPPPPGGHAHVHVDPSK
jgi:subtilase family serine protease